MLLESCKYRVQSRQGRVDLGQGRGSRVHLCLMCLPGLDDSDELVLQWAADGAGSVAGAVGGAVTNQDQLSLNSFSLRGWRTEENLRVRVNASSDEHADRFGRVG